LDKQYISKLYLQAYQKYIFNLKLGRAELVSYYTGQLAMLTDSFSNYLGTTEEIQRLKDKAEANALEHYEFYEKSNIEDII
jgi:tRNA(Glu) U13 pseudouridine synthase TruD